MIIASPLELENTAYEANAIIKNKEPTTQTISQDLENLMISPAADGFSQLVVSRAANTGDQLDFLFLATDPTTIQLQWALGPDGADTNVEHQYRGVFTNPLVLTAVPVPAALPLLASGLFALGMFTRRKKAA